MSNYHALLFEAASIQQYLLSSGRLRDIIGASELVDSLTGGVLDDALQSLGFQEGRELVFSRRAGGAFYAFSGNGSVLEDLLALYTLLVQQIAPDLAYDVGLGAGDSMLKAYDAARQALREDGAHTRPRLPLGSPLAMRSRRTGNVAEKEHKKDGFIDAATNAKKCFADLSRAGFIGRFSPEGVELGWRDWPRNLELDADDAEGAFPFKGEDQTIALLHADGNGLGQLLISTKNAVANKPEQFAKAFRTLSDIIAEAMTGAAQDAVEQVILPAREDNPCLPARPILLGGDDLTILVRADLAVDFAQQFTTAFEKRSPDALKKLRDQGVDSLPEKLTIGAGLVFMRASQPFYLASHLAEALMGEAKRRAKAIDMDAPPSSLAFHRVTSSLVDDYSQILATELCHASGDKSYCNTLGAYALGDSNDLPRLEDLKQLARLLNSKEMARGPTRQLLTLMGASIGEAERRYRRWRELMQENKPGLLKDFDALMEKLGGEMLKELPYSRDSKGEHKSPLGDALALMGAGAVSAGDEENTQGNTMSEEAAA